MKSHFIIPLLISQAAIFLCGCATDRDPLAIVPANERAALYYGLPVSLAAVDGQSEYYTRHTKWSGTPTVYLSPGSHTLTIGYEDTLLVDTMMSANPSRHLVSDSPKHLQFVAEAGHTYTLDGKSEESSWSVTLADDAAGPSANAKPRKVGGQLRLLYDVATPP